MLESNPYLTLKLAHELFNKAPTHLTDDERRHLDQVAARQSMIERRILGTLDAARVILPVSSVAQALGEIRARYATEDEYRTDLERSGIDEVLLKAAIERDLKVNAVLERVASEVPEVSDTDCEIFFLLHRSRFIRPEKRTLKHILVTVDSGFPGSERQLSWRKIEEIRDRLVRSPERFAEQALKHSECPTAMEGGLLGTLPRGELYEELEAAAFALSLGELSDIVESPLGFHLVHCVAIEAESTFPLATVREKIREHLLASRRKSAQKDWIKGLFRKEAA